MNIIKKILLLPLLFAVPAGADEISVAVHPDSPVVKYALTRLTGAVETAGHRLVSKPLEQADSCSIILCSGEEQAQRAKIEAPKVGAEGYRLYSRSKSDRKVWIAAGADDRGLLYGTLDLAEQIHLAGSLDSVQEQSVSPKFAFRAIKYNLPWMSYRRGKALQVHMDTCRDLKYWQAFLDMMADNRFNVLTLWNLHPFTFMIRPENFPEACPFHDEELADWRNFWKSLFTMAKERGIETYIVNWNIFVSPEFAEAKNAAEYSKNWQFWGEGDPSKLIERYTRQCVRQVIDEYEDLTGIGVTLGERMGGMTAEQRRDWIDRTVIAGMKSAKRKAKLLYRAPLSAGTDSGGSTSLSAEQLTRGYLESLEGIAEPIHISFKFNWSHGHSSPHLVHVHGGELTDTYWNPKPKKYKVLWTLRNEDFFVLRWGQPDFIREFIQLNSPDYVDGCIIGSECYIPAEDYITRPGDHKTWDYAFQRQWLFYLMWGRLLYDPQTPDALYAAHLGNRFGEQIGADLLQAWKLASSSANRFASFYRGSWDASIYTEGFTGWRDRNPVHFVSVEALSRRSVLDPDYISVTDYVKAGGKTKPGKVSPMDLADLLEADCGRALELVEMIRTKVHPDPTLECELADIESWCHHGRYFAHKLRGTSDLLMYRSTGREPLKIRAVGELEKALTCWQQLIESITRYNQEVIPYVFDEEFSWKKYLDDVRKDIEFAKSAQPDD